jgi:hypothetical protein
MVRWPSGTDPEASLVSRELAPLPDKPLLGTSEAAACLGTGERSVLTALARGRFPGAYQDRGAWQIPTSEVERLRVELGITSPNVR